MATMFNYQTERFEEPIGPRNYTRDRQTGYLDIPMGEENEPRICEEGACDCLLDEEAVALAECMEVYGCQYSFCAKHVSSYDVPEMPKRARACLLAHCPELGDVQLKEVA